MKLQSNLTHRSMIVLYYVCALLFFFPEAKAQNRYSKQYVLDTHVVYTIPVAFDKGVTTLFFPTGVSAIRGQKIAVEPSQIEGNDFYLKMAPNSYFFSVNALHMEAKQPISVIFNKKAFTIILVASKEPLLNVSFVDSNRLATLGSGSNDPIVPTVRLFSMLDQAKDYVRLSEYHPDAVVDIDHVKPARIIHYDGFDVLIDDVWRFEEEDSLVFRLIFRNNTTETIYYRPKDVAIGIAERIYPIRFWDASGQIPAGVLNPVSKKIAPSQTISYFILVGNPEGGRNNLAPNNSWNILIPRAQTTKRTDIPQIEIN